MQRKTRTKKLFNLLILFTLLASTALGSAMPLKPQVAQAAALAVPQNPQGFGTPVIDGVIDTIYGSPIASDPSGDGNGNANMDLLELYAAQDDTYFYFAFTVNADIATTNWGKYAIYVDTTNDADGATSDAWGRNVIVNDSHKPEFGIYSWVDSPPYDPSHTQVVPWDQGTTSWDWGSAGQLDEVAIGAGATSVVEWKIAKSTLGDPETIWLEVWDTGGGGGDNAQDTINNPADDWNAADWATQADLDVSTQFGAPSIDGERDQIWGDPVAEDPLGDIDEPNLDLNGLYLIEDADNYYIGFDAFASTWGMTYGIYLDTDLVDGSGAASDPWGRAVNAISAHLPEYALYVYHEDTDVLQDVQLTHWNGGGWDYPTLISVGGAQGYGPANDWIEYKVPKAALGNPTAIALEVFTTGGSGHAQDTVPSDPNVAYSSPDWGGDTTTLSAFYVHPQQVLSLLVNTPNEGEQFALADIDVTGSVEPTVGVTVTVDLNGSATYTPTIALSGAFTQSLTLDVGDNTITVSATDGSETKEVVRHVTFGASHDNNIWWNELGHDSRDGLYRNPGGAVITGTLVTLRLRAANNDLTGVKLRLYNDRTNQESLVDMARVASDGTYEYWEYQVDTGADPTVYWYRFIPMDGTAAAYYEDDAARTGGWGQTFSESQDNSWQLTVYDPAFQTPDWVKNAVIYQIFPDRFRDGDPTNDTPAGSFFYEESPTIVRSNDPLDEWNAAICDPRDATSDCPNIYSQNFYGGDLQGIIDKLDYLDNLGVTAIYMNPIFESPSNHKYDTTDYSIIDDNFGDLATFQTLVSEANSHGIHIILDGVFNHTSSDSIYFDRYGRYDEVGACESPDSPYRDWYYFTDVTPGTGECAGSDGTPEAATYESWFGYASLPKLNANSQAVRDLIWNTGTSSIAPYWVDQGAEGWRLDVAGDVDPGVTGDPTNDYWEGFRQALHMVNPDTYVVGEEWGNASPWLLGSEWDATMNYQYSSAMLSFFRDTPFEDNDHNSGSSAGILTPLDPSDLNERLLNWIERYPPEALYAMMNLLGSHDTNRPLFMLDHNAATGTDDSLLDDPNYDWSDAITRLKGVAILQMTLPGAPTIYYGDEVGTVGPVTYAGGRWEDDPYNRVPYPWLDENGTPFYTFLQSQSNQDDLYDYYALLTAARQDNEALRTGSFDPLLTDDSNSVYAYGRKLADHSNAAIVAVNKTGSDHLTTINLDGYLPYGALFKNIFTNTYYVINGSGEITVNVPAMSGVILVPATSIATAPAAVDDLAVTGESNGQIDLGWSAASGADSYDIYRSLLSGGGYTFVANTASTSYTDSGLQNAVDYYYVIVSRDDVNGLVSGYSNEVMGTPQHDLSGAWYNLQWPTEITHTISAITETENIYGQLWIDGATGGSGPATGIQAQVGYGISGTLPASWDWVDMSYWGIAGGNDEYKGNLLPDMVGDYQYATRWSSDGGQNWYFSDLSGPGDNSNYGVLHVVASSDATAPDAPQNLMVSGSSTSSISLSWDANTEPDLAGYDVYRQPAAGGYAPTAFEWIARVGSDVTSYTDTSVVTDESYDYYIVAFDTSFNFSAASNTVTGTAENRMVTVTFRVQVPEHSPGTIYIAGDLPGYPQWNPGAQPMTQVSTSPNVWEIDLSLPDGLSSAMYKYTRGSWDTVEWWGTIISLNNRNLPTIAYGTTGTMLVDDTATDWGTGSDDHKAVQYWRDPYVITVDPTDGAVGVPMTTTVSLAWSQSMPTDTEFTITGPSGVVSGTFGYDDLTYTVVFTPTETLEVGTYTVSASGLQDSDGDTQQVPFTSKFTVGYVLYMPTVFKEWTP